MLGRLSCHQMLRNHFAQSSNDVFTRANTMFFCSTNSCSWPCQAGKMSCSVKQPFPWVGLWNINLRWCLLSDSPALTWCFLNPLIPAHDDFQMGKITRAQPLSRIVEHRSSLTPSLWFTRAHMMSFDSTNSCAWRFSNRKDHARSTPE